MVKVNFRRIELHVRGDFENLIKTARIHEIVFI